MHGGNDDRIPSVHILVGNLQQKKPHRRHKRIVEDNIKIDDREMNICEDV